MPSSSSVAPSSPSLIEKAMRPRSWQSPYPASADAQPFVHSECDCGKTEVYTRHDDLWFSDGSVVLAAERTLFRVHSSLLSRHSLFFRDMFSLPQPLSQKAPAVRPVIDDPDAAGCPVVHLHDSAEDLANLLCALYDGPAFGNNDKADFRVVSGILRLASKYIIDSLRTKALDHLSTAWPSTLKGWDAREDLAGEYYVDVEGQRYYPSPVEVINLAREINAVSLLPAAFYDLSRYQLSQVFEQSGDELSLHALSLADTQKLVLGREAAHYAVTGLIHAMGSGMLPHTHAHGHMHLHGGAGGAAHAPGHARGGGGGGASPLRAGRHKRGASCTSAAACRRDVSELVDLATQHYLFDRERGASDPLYVAEELGLLKSAEMEGSECKACGRALEMWAAKERERLWRLIPSWFRLDG